MHEAALVLAYVPALQNAHAVAPVVTPWSHPVGQFTHAVLDPGALTPHEFAQFSIIHSPTSGAVQPLIAAACAQLVADIPPQHCRGQPV